MRNQQIEETVSEYLQILNQLSKDCDFTDVKAEEYRKEYIRDAFIRGLKCPRIRQRLLENTSMTLDQAFEQARTLESAEVHAASYMGSSFPVQSAAMKTEDFSEETVATSAASSSFSRSQTCFFCGNDLHSRTLCLARDVTCRNCGKKGHYQ
ncbi:putative retrovirus-related pol polyprotein from transposon opus [Trichonephila clavipes]|nr:putative retrovirus-related pol polyprotein from transposon opus [Trichonephila clavipes]